MWMQFDCGGSREFFKRTCSLCLQENLEALCQQEKELAEYEEEVKELLFNKT